MWQSRIKLSICMAVVLFLIVTSFVNIVNAECSTSGISTSATVDTEDISDQLEDETSLDAGALYAKSYIVDTSKFLETSNQRYENIDRNAPSEEGQEDRQEERARGARAGRATDQESEPNNDEANGNELTGGNNMQGNLSFQTDEEDHFYINLNGGGGATTEKITITPTFISPPNIQDKAIGLYLSLYELYDSDRYYLNIVKLATTTYGPFLSPYPWPTVNELIAHADSTQKYMLVVEGAWFVWSGNNTVIHPGVVIGYDLEIEVTTTVDTDKNNDMFNGTVIDGPTTGDIVTQATDHWDWFIVETQTTEKLTHTRVQLKITDSERTETDSVTGFVFYVKVFVELIYYDSDTEQYIKVSGTGDDNGQYGPNPIIVEINDTYEKAYLGIHSQQLYKYGGQDRYESECGESFIAYKIEKLDVDLYNKPPYFTILQVSPNEGNKLQDYTFAVIYRDYEGDPPLFVNVTVDGINYEMALDTSASSIYQDGDFANGEQYVKVVPGSALTTPVHVTYKDIQYYFSTRDYMESLGLPLSFHKSNTYSFQVIDNTPPELSSDPPEEWIVYEDTNASYFNITTIFEDLDEANYPDELTYEIYTPDYGQWNVDRVVTDNMTIKLIETNWTLSCEPFPNKFGIDYVNIRASDAAGSNQKPPVYVYHTLKVNLKPVNDAPVLNPILEYRGDPPIPIYDYIDDYAMREDWWCNINFTANDDIDGNVDTLTFSTNILSIIPFLDPDDPDYNDDYQYDFDEETGHLSFIPANEQVGKYKVTVWVTDAGEIEPIGLSDTITFWFEIENTNDPPQAVISSPEDGDIFNTSVEIFFDGMNSTDPDLEKNVDKLRYIWKSNVSGTLKSGETYGKFLMTIDEAGLHEIELTVKDNDRKTSTTTIEIKIIGIVEGIGEDTDGDGIPDSWESQYGLNPDRKDSAKDKDNDNYTNLQEFLGKDELPGGSDSSDPTDAYSIPGDIDADELDDDWEKEHFGHLNLDGFYDPDGDEFSNLQEFQVGTDPNEPDTDGDGHIDGRDDYPLDSSQWKEGGEDGDIEEEDYTWIIIILIIVIIIILLLMTMFIKKRREEEREAEEELAAMASREQPPRPMMPMPVAAPPPPPQAMAPPPVPPMTAPQPLYAQGQPPPTPIPPQMMPAAISMGGPPPPPPSMTAPAQEPLLPPGQLEETLPEQPRPEYELEEGPPKPPKRKKPKVQPPDVAGGAAKGPTPKPKVKGPKLKSQKFKCPSCGIPVQPSWFLCPSCKTPLS